MPFVKVPQGRSIRGQGMVARVDARGTMIFNKEATEDFIKYYDYFDVLADTEENLIGIQGNKSEGLKAGKASTYQSRIGSYGLTVAGLKKMPEVPCSYKAYVKDDILVIDLNQPIGTTGSTPHI